VYCFIHVKGPLPMVVGSTPTLPTTFPDTPNQEGANRKSFIVLKIV